MASIFPIVVDNDFSNADGDRVLSIGTLYLVRNDYNNCVIASPNNATYFGALFHTNQKVPYPHTETTFVGIIIGSSSSGMCKLTSGEPSALLVTMPINQNISETYIGYSTNWTYDDYVYNPGKFNPIYGVYENFDAALAALQSGPIPTYPITYSATNGTVSGPTEAAIGDTVIVSAVPDVDYGITDASSQIIVTNNDVAVPYTWDAANQRITFTMPDPT